jgi:hypothetical protein
LLAQQKTRTIKILLARARKYLLTTSQRTSTAFLVGKKT